MKKRIFTVEVTQTVKVVLDENVLNDDFNAEFSAGMWDVDKLEDHAKHLAQMEARGLIGFNNFVEGYGDIKALGLSAVITDQREEII